MLRTHPLLDNVYPTNQYRQPTSVATLYVLDEMAKASGQPWTFNRNRFKTVLRSLANKGTISSDPDFNMSQDLAQWWRIHRALAAYGLIELRIQSMKTLTPAQVTTLRIQVEKTLGLETDITTMARDLKGLRSRGLIKPVVNGRHQVFLAEGTLEAWEAWEGKYEAELIEPDEEEEEEEYRSILPKLPEELNISEAWSRAKAMLPARLSAVQLDEEFAARLNKWRDVA